MNKIYQGKDPYGHSSSKTENQIRNWIDLKLKNYLWKIKGNNSHGSRKKLETISADLKIIIKNLDNYLRK